MSSTPSVTRSVADRSYTEDGDEILLDLLRDGTGDVVMTVLDASDDKDELSAEDVALRKLVRKREEEVRAELERLGAPPRPDAIRDARDAILEEIVMTLEDDQWNVLADASTPGAPSAQTQVDDAAPEPRIAVVQRQTKRDAGRGPTETRDAKTRSQEDPDSEMSDSGPAPIPPSGGAYPPIQSPKKGGAPSVGPATTEADDLTDRLAQMQIGKMRAERGEVKARAKARAKAKAEARRRELVVAGSADDAS